MNLCPNGGNPIIYWQFGGGQLKKIVGADDYIAEEEKGKCPAYYHVFGTFYSKNSSAGGCNVTSYFRTSKAVLGTDVKSYAPVGTSGRWGIEMNNGYLQQFNYLFYARYEEKYMVNDRRTSGIVNYDGEACFNITRPAYGHSCQVTDVLRVDGLPDDCGNGIFKAFKNGELVLEDIGQGEPEVTVECGDACPPGTCEADCGSHVCCYNASGKAVFSFNK